MIRVSADEFHDYAKAVGFEFVDLTGREIELMWWDDNGSGDAIPRQSSGEVFKTDTISESGHLVLMVDREENGPDLKLTMPSRYDHDGDSRITVWRMVPSDTSKDGEVEYLKFDEDFRPAQQRVSDHV